MPYRPNKHQAAVLSALEHLQTHGCEFEMTTGAPKRWRIVFADGVPESILQAWIGRRVDSRDADVMSLFQRQLIARTTMHYWLPLTGTTASFTTPDDRRVRLKWGPWRAPKKSSQTAPTSRTTREAHGAGLLPFFVTIQESNSSGSTARPKKYGAVYERDFGPAYAITQEGLALLDSLKEEGEVNELVTLDQVATLTGNSKRTLERYLAQNKLPQPDYPGGGGHAHKWIWRNVRPSLEKITRRILPGSFPGSRII